VSLITYTHNNLNLVDVELSSTLIVNLSLNLSTIVLGVGCLAILR
jgi:hypothetical protein